jgi:flagellar assembly factor FliW|uniref:Flagellar assembly factor FliW n=1 Tax=Mesoaciditoga lauensis TaxID=1495039 RepID=A0A7V3VTH6_9BACT
MIFETKIGSYDIKEESIFKFAEGIPGFENLKRFAVLSRADTEPIKWFVSLEDKNVALPIIDPWLIFKDYSFTLNEEMLKRIENPKRENVLIFCVIDLHRPNVTVNLMAPIVINIEKGIGSQIIVEGTKYTSRHSVKV